MTIQPTHPDLDDFDNLDDVAAYAAELSGKPIEKVTLGDVKQTLTAMEADFERRYGFWENL